LEDRGLGEQRVKVLVGTSGYSYKQWKGRFYPEDLPDSDMLTYYGTRFRSVEINNTFYRMPSRDVLGKWAERVPSEFVFVLKAPRRITHEKRLKAAEGEIGHLLEVSSVLGARLGPLLFQLPPFQKKDGPRLRDFLSLIPSGQKAAFEFRHESWFDSEVLDILSSRGAALCHADTEESTEQTIRSTSTWGYLRLRRPDYDEAALRAWADRIREQAWSEVFVFFKHEDEARGPALAVRFQELAEG
jgi:uncharacterized protein YecE (DUF72 family)